MRQRAVVLLGTMFFSLGFGVSCSVTESTIDGPMPVPTSVARSDQGFPSEAVYCTELGGSIQIEGLDFSPLPIDVLTEQSSILLPTIALVPQSGSATTLDGVSFDQKSRTLSAIVPQNLAVGIYDLRVTNPNQNEGTLEGAVVLVSPPELTSILPDEATNVSETPVTITGNYFRTGADNILPSVYLTFHGTNDMYSLINVVRDSATQISAVVPASLPVGVYDLTVLSPEGCSVTLDSAYTVLPPVVIDLCASVDPAFGWIGERTKIEICASNAESNGLQSTPEVFILIPDAQDSSLIHEIPLIREAFLTLGDQSEPSVMSAVVPSSADDVRIRIGGPYPIKVVNPDGGQGVIEGAFTLLPDPPPDILAINPARGDKETTQTISITGLNFKDGLLTDGVTPILSIAMLDENWTEAATCNIGTIVVEKDIPDVGDRASCEMMLPNVGAYVVQVKHEDDGSYDLYAAFAVTAPSGKLDEQPILLGNLNQARRAHGVAVGHDDVGNRFVYVAGGEGFNQTQSSMEVLDSVEVSVMSNFGQLGEWTVLVNKLPEPRTGLSLLNVERYLYAIGGTSDGENPAQHSDTTKANVLRAKILGADTAPEIQTTAREANGSLTAGTWYYKVSAIMKNTTDNPLGETLPSDEESIRVAADSAITLTWKVIDPDAVDHFRVYRSPESNGLSGTEVLLADNVPVGGAETSWTDTGESTVTSDVTPLVPGSIGVWVEMVELDTARYDAASTVVRTDSENVFLYVTGGRTGPVANPADNVTASTEWLALTADGRDPKGSWNAGTDMNNARAEHVLVKVVPGNASQIASNFYIVAVGGSAGDRGEGDPIKDIESSLIDTVTTPGTIADWRLTGLTIQNNRIGLTAIHVNDYLYAFNGWGGGGAGNFANAGEKSNTETTEDCAADCYTDFSSMSSTTINFTGVGEGVQYRAGLVFFGAYFYWIGGSSNTQIENTSSVVVQGRYSESG